MHSRHKAINKYLANYAEPETASLQSLKIDRAEQVLIIPCYRESSDFYQRLLPLMKRHSVLLILVVNQPASLSQPHSDNKTLYQQIHHDLQHRQSVNNICYGKVAHSNSAVLLVDRYSQQPLPDAQGVGLARKIGNDIALHLLSDNLISTSLLFNTDADTHLPEDYFNHATNIYQQQFSALLYPFTHNHSNCAVGRASTLYEKKLQHYVAGLQSAGSAYAFHTVGSTIAVAANAYAEVRGFPKRSAGEDFYLLNKLAKVGTVATIEAPGARIQIESRISDRVPFGTGPAVSQLVNCADPDHHPLFYHPDIFVLLKQTLDTLAQCPRNLAQCSLPSVVCDALQAMDIDRCFSHLNKQCKTDSQYRRQLNQWFDAFRTMKFVHYLRDHGYANVSLRQLETIDG